MTLTPQPPADGSQPMHSQKGFVVAWLTVLVLLFCSVVSWTDRMLISLVVDPIRHSFGISDVQVGIIQGPAFSVFYAFSALLFGYFGDRANRKRLLFFCISLWGAATIGTGLASNYETLFLMRALVGVGEAGLPPLVVSIICDLFPSERRGAPLATWQLGSVFGATIAFTVGGVVLRAVENSATAQLLISPDDAWRAIFILIGLVGSAAAVLLLSFIPQTPRTASEPPPNVSAALILLRGNAHIYVPLFGAYASLSVATNGLLAWFPAMLLRQPGADPARVGVLVGGLVLLSGTLGVLTAGALADRVASRFGERNRFFLSFVSCVALGLSSLLLVRDNAYANLASLFLANALSYFAAIALYIGYADMVPAHARASGIAILTTTNILIGIGVGPLAVPLLVTLFPSDGHALRYSLVTLVGGCGALSSLLCFVVYAIKRRTDSVKS